MDEKNKYISEIVSKLSDLEIKLDEIRAERNQLTPDWEGETVEDMINIQTLRSTIAEKVSEMRNNGDSNWDELRINIDKLMLEIQKSFNEFKTSLND